MKITELAGIGEKRAAALADAGIFSVFDLLNRFPRDYDDRSRVKTVTQLVPEAVNTIRGVVAYDPECANLRGKLSITKVKIKDHTGVLEIVWFNQPYLKKFFKRGGEYIFTGKVREPFGLLQMVSPEYEAASETELSGGRIVPIYTAPKQFSQKTFRKLIYAALAMPLPFSETLPDEIRGKYKLCGRAAAVRNIHFPESDELFFAARRRLVFEELFFMQAALFQLRGAVKAQAGILFAKTDYAPFLRALEFTPTAAQTKVLGEIAADLRSGSRMNRLVQGDVGSGKTAVAFAAAFLAATNGYQTALMAPTDVLANQHFSACKRLFSPLGYEAVLLTGGIGAKARRETLAKIADGTARIIIGTHALIQESVEYARLGLCITDEQHRFGVNQRLALSQKGSFFEGGTGETFFPKKVSPGLPHVLVMTATPIPRTLGLILYGDLDISVINELPPGRQKIKTYCVDSKYRSRVNNFILKETARNRQVYIICPSIEESAEIEMQNVAAYTRGLSAALPKTKIAYLHGRLKPAEKQQTMDAFKAGEIQVIVSTTVIEVGVHVENATLIIVENAERFGLSQLHQLRGRVGRGGLQSYCVLITDSKNEQTLERLNALCQTNDGFALAEKDLELRGAGDFFGTRQHGLPAFTIANLYTDMEILREAQEAAKSDDTKRFLSSGHNVPFPEITQIVQCV